MHGAIINYSYVIISKVHLCMFGFHLWHKFLMNMFKFKLTIKNPLKNGILIITS